MNKILIMAEIILNFDGNGDERNVAEYSNICSGKIINTSISNAWDGVSFTDKGNGYLAINVPKNPSSTKGRKTEAVISYSTSDGFICETHTVLLCQKNSNGGSKTYTYGTASVTKTVSCSGGDILLSTDRMPYTATTSGGETETGYTSASLNVSVAECTEPNGCTTSSRGTASPGGTIEYTIAQNGCGSLCNCDKLIINEISAISSGGGIYNVATYDDCLTGFTINTAGTPSGMITSTGATNGDVTITFASNPTSDNRQCTCSITYGFDAESCSKSLSFIQEAAPRPKATLTLSNGNTVIIPYDGNEVLTYANMTTARVASLSDIVSVHIEDCVTKIGNYAFLPSAFTNLTSITMADSVTEIENDICSASYGGAPLKSITFSNNLTTIGRDAFWGCSNLTGVTFPNTLVYLNNSCFRDCNLLTKINIPDSVQVIGFDAFYWCRGLTEVTIGTGWTGTTEIGRSFENCPNLMKVTSKAVSPPNIVNEWYFCYSSSLGSCWKDGFKIYVPSNSVDSYKRATGWSYYKDVIVPIS